MSDDPYCPAKAFAALAEQVLDRTPPADGAMKTGWRGSRPLSLVVEIEPGTEVYMPALTFVSTEPPPGWTPIALAVEDV